MKRALKNAGLAALTSAPIYGLLKARAHRGNPDTILCYHTLRPQSEVLDAWIALGVEDFKSQVTTLRKSYEIVGIDDLFESERRSKPRLVLTFDDGEFGLFDHLLPIVEAENLPVTVYVATGQIESGHAYWFDRVMNALQGPGVTKLNSTLGSSTIGPERGKARWAQISAVLEALKRADPKERNTLADEIVAQADPVTGAFTPLQPMSIEQLQTLAAHPCVTIGAHSHCHNLLDQIPVEQATTSVAKSRRLLEEWTEQSVRHFAYPNGNYTPELMQAIKGLGFTSATILEDRLVQEDHAMALPRIGVGRYDALNRLRLRMVGV